jgi:SNF2 family DNA or RNA helicase
MGLGKTVQTLCLVGRTFEEGEGRPVLLVCPTSLIGNWHREAERFLPDLPVEIHHGAQRTAGAPLKERVAAIGRGSLVVTSYGVLARDALELAEIDWSAVILDEAQLVKNPHTRAARAARSLKADFRVALTGTPVENHVGDLWSVMEFLNPGHLGHATQFRDRFLRPISMDPGGEASRTLKRLTGPFLLRRRKTDPNVAPDLPGKLENKVACTLTTEQASLYRAVVRELEESIAEGGDRPSIQRQGLVLAAFTRLKQVVNHPAHFLGDGSPLEGRSGKLARLEGMLSEVVSEGESALVFTQFARWADLLQEHLAKKMGAETLLLTGSTSREERDRIVRRFQDGTPDPRLLVLTLKAGGTGLNLTRATHVFHFDRWWNPAVENQATDRAYRIGQTRTVEVHKFLCMGTLEERIDALLEKKTQMAEEVVGTGEGWLASLDTDTLRELLRLSPEAVTG